MAMVAGLSCELAKRSHEVDVLCTDRPSGSAHEAQWIDRLEQSGIAVRFLGRKPGSAGLSAAMELLWLIQSRGYDIVHSHLPMPDAMSGLARRIGFRRFGHVVTVHNSHEPRSWSLAALAAGANVVYCSDVARKRNPLTGVSTTVIPNGIAQAHYAGKGCTKHQIRQQLGIPADTKVIITVGRMCPQKNFATAMEALLDFEQRQTLPSILCLFCGDGEDRKQLEMRASQMGLEKTVRFLGARTDIPDLLTASDVFLSTSRYEGMPLTVLEALSAGLICVLSDIEEHREIAASAPGCFFAPNSPGAVASALAKATMDHADPELLRDARGPLLEKHTIAHCADSYEGLYRHALHREHLFHTIAANIGNTSKTERP
jgi:glycosyltransferase involved in cell wall biosynthesis